MAERRKDNKRRVLKEGEYQRSNGSYEYKWRDRFGKRHSVYAKTLEELREKEQAITRDTLEGLTVQLNALTINDMFYRWQKIKRGLKENTFQNYQYMYLKFVAPRFGKIRLSDLRRSDVRAFYNSIIDNGDMKVSTLDSVHTILHQVLGLAVEDEYLRFNPADGALKELKRSMGRSEKTRRALTVQEQQLFEKFLAESPEYNRWQPVFTTMLWTGMRVGEVTGLRWCDVDFEEKTISINHTLVNFSKGKANGGNRFAINTPKTQAGTRVIPMLPIVENALLLEKSHQEKAGQTCRAVIDGYTDFIFINRFGDAQHQGTLNKALRRIIHDCNLEVLANNPDDNPPVLLPDFSNHTLRHTFATRMCEANLNIKAMQNILGHKDIETTMDIYVDASADLTQKEMINLANYFNQPLHFNNEAYDSYDQFTTKSQKDA